MNKNAIITPLNLSDMHSSEEEEMEDNLVCTSITKHIDLHRARRNSSRRKGRSEDARWINNHTVVKEDAEKPCHTLKHCLYGQLVEAFPLQDGQRDYKACGVFGHDCPIFYHYENVKEDE